MAIFLYNISLYICVAIYKGVIMSVNFGYGGYGMAGNMNAGQMGMMVNQGGGISQSIASQYNCPTCYQYGPVPYNYKSNVNPLPQYAIKESWLSRLARKIMG